RQVLEMEPALRGADGGLLHSEEGAVDNVALLATLARFIARELSAIHRVNAAAVALQRDGDWVRVVLDGGGSVRGSRVVLAAGAWTPNLRGLPRPLPVAPLRGQMLAMEGELLNHVVYAPGGYALPRAGRTLVGATMEEVGFDAGT